MTESPALYRDGTPPYQRSSSTSRAAAASVAERAPSQQQRVLGYIRASGRGGLTNYEIVAKAQATWIRHSVPKIPLQSVCARVNRLVALGHVRDSGRTRPSPSGRQATVWLAVSEAERDAALEQLRLVS